MQTLRIESHSSDPYVVLKAVGELDLHTQDEFEHAVLEPLRSSPVVVDLSEVDFLAVSALRSLLACHGRAAADGRQLLFAQPSRQAVRLLSLAGLDRVLPVRPTVAEAVCESVVVLRPLGGLADQAVGDLTQLDVG